MYLKYIAILFLLINYTQCSNIIYIDKMSIDYNLTILDGELYSYDFYRFYINFYNDYNCKDFRYGGEDKIAAFCKDRCSIYISDQNLNNWYGNSVSIIYKKSGKVWCSNSKRNGWYLKDNLPAPFDLKFSVKELSTKGGTITMSAEYLRSVPLNSRLLTYSTLGKNYTISISNETIETFKSSQFKPLEYTFKIGPGAGSLDLNYYHSFKTLSYPSPVINSVKYNSNGVFEIIGNNFYENKDLLLVIVNNAQVPNNNIISVSNHTNIKFKYQIINSGSYKVNLRVSGITSLNSKEIKIIPIINSIKYYNDSSNTTQTLRFNGSFGDGKIITITGSYLSGNKNIAPSPILFGSDKCTLVSYTSNSIICNLTRSSNNIKSVKVYVSINGSKNQDINNTFIF